MVEVKRFIRIFLKGGKVNDHWPILQEDRTSFRHPSVLRAKGTPGRGAGRRRVYDEGDLEWVRFLCRLKETGMPLRDIRRCAQLRYAGPGTMSERLVLLRVHRRYVLEQRDRWDAYPENPDGKISCYEKAIREAEA